MNYLEQVFFGLGAPCFFGLIAFLFWPESKEKVESAWDILRKKFAEGILTVEEYQERKALLEYDKLK